MFTVYALHDPRDQSIHYVGCIGGYPMHVRPRVHGHVSAAKSGKTPPVTVWVRSLLDASIAPAFSILETGNGEPHIEGSIAERAHIARLRAEGAPLKNVLDGGMGRPQRRRALNTYTPWSAERRARQMAAFAKRKRGAIVCLTPEAR